MKHGKNEDRAWVDSSSRSTGNCKMPEEEEFIQLGYDELFVIQYMTNVSEAQYESFINEYSFAIQYIKKPSEKLQLLACGLDGLSIQHIKKPSEAVQLIAVKEDSYAIRYIKKPSEAVQLLAIQEDPTMADSIDKPIPEVILAYHKEGVFSKTAMKILMKSRKVPRHLKDMILFQDL